MCYKFEGWTQLVRERDQWLDLLNTVMNLQISYTVGQK